MKQMDPANGKCRQQTGGRRKRKSKLPLQLAIFAIILVVGCLVGTLAFRVVVETVAEIKDDKLAETVPWPGTAPYVIAVDAGHGGTDSGATGIINELDVTIPTAEYLAEWLEKDENFTPQLTHEYSASATPAMRREAAQDANAVLLFSIHANANIDSSSISGFEVYVENQNKPYHEQSYQLAMALTQLLWDAGNSPQAGSGIFYCHYEGNDKDGYEKNTVPESKETLYGLTGQSFGVLESDQMPAVLMEQGYLTNEQDVSEWLSDDGCRKAARVYYEAICKLFGTQPLAE